MLPAHVDFLDSPYPGFLAGSLFEIWSALRQWSLLYCLQRNRLAIRLVEAVHSVLYTSQQIHSNEEMVMKTRRFDCVDYEEDGQIAIIRMNNNERRNSLNLSMRRGLNGVFDQFEENDNIRVAILTGVGNSFCSGQDTEDKDMVGLSEEERKRQAEKRRKLSRWGAFEHRDRIPKPVIAAVNGWAIGYGWFVAMGCNLVVVTCPRIVYHSKC